MSKNSNLYIGIGLVIFGIVELFENEFDEFILYSVLGTAFMITWYSMKEGLPPKRKKVLGTISWIMIGLSLFWFLYLVRTDSYR